MTVSELLEQAKSLSPAERRELAKLLIDTFEITPQERTEDWKTGSEIVAMIHDIGSIEFVDDDIDDPVEWLNTQRQKRKKQLGELTDRNE